MYNYMTACLKEHFAKSLKMLWKTRKAFPQV